MANSGLIASGIVLMIIGLIAYLVPIENYINIESDMSNEEICENLGMLMPPKYQEYCDKSKGVIENPTPYIVLGGLVSMGIGVIVTIIGAVSKRKVSGMLMCKECDFAANTKADLHNHCITEHPKEEKEDKES